MHIGDVVGISVGVLLVVICLSAYHRKATKKTFMLQVLMYWCSTIYTWLNPSFFLKECKLVFEYPNQPLVERKELHFGPLCNWRVGSRHWCFHTWNTLPGWNRGVMPLRSGKRIAHFGIHYLQLSIPLKWEKSRAFFRGHVLQHLFGQQRQRRRRSFWKTTCQEEKATFIN